MVVLQEGGQPLRIVAVRRRYVPVEGVVGVPPDADRVILAHRLGRLGGTGFADRHHVVLHGVEVAEGPGLLGERHEVAAPQ